MANITLTTSPVCLTFCKVLFVTKYPIYIYYNVYPYIVNYVTLSQ